MSYSTYYLASSNNVQYARMNNSAGKIQPIFLHCYMIKMIGRPSLGAIIDATIPAVQSALTEVIPNLTSTYLGPDVIDGQLSTSWPICMVTYGAVFLSTTTTDCSHIQNALLFLAWSQLTPLVSTNIQAIGQAPLPFGFQT